MLPPVTNPNLALKVYAGFDSSLIWWDKGSGGHSDVSTHRPGGPDGYYPIGDIALGNYGTPNVAHLVKAVKTDALTSPISFRPIWNDACRFWF